MTNKTTCLINLSNSNQVVGKLIKCGNTLPEGNISVLLVCGKLTGKNYRLIYGYSKNMCILQRFSLNKFTRKWIQLIPNQNNDKIDVENSQAQQVI